MLSSKRSTFIDNSCSIEFPKLDLIEKAYPQKTIRGCFSNTKKATYLNPIFDIITASYYPRLGGIIDN